MKCLALLNVTEASHDDINQTQTVKKGRFTNEKVRKKGWAGWGGWGALGKDCKHSLSHFVRWEKKIYLIGMFIFTIVGFPMSNDCLTLYLELIQLKRMWVKQQIKKIKFLSGHSFSVTWCKSFRDVFCYQ